MLNDVTDARGGGYMSFGQSGSSSASEMTGADVFVAFWSERGDATVVDYKLSAKAQVQSLQAAVLKLASTVLHNFHI